MNEEQRMMLTNQIRMANLLSVETSRLKEQYHQYYCQMPIGLQLDVGELQTLLNEHYRGLIPEDHDITMVDNTTEVDIGIPDGVSIGCDTSNDGVDANHHPTTTYHCTIVAESGRKKQPQQKIQKIYMGTLEKHAGNSRPWKVFKCYW
jgi:hypothetical protein